MAAPVDLKWNNNVLDDITLDKVTYGQGTSFPATWPANRLFLRTDTELLYTNTGTEASPTFVLIGVISGLGTTLQILRTNAGATAAEWVEPPAVVVYRLVVTANKNGNTSATKLFNPFGSDDRGNASASNMDNPISVTTALTLIRLVINVESNGQTSGTNPVTFVDDGATATSVDTGTTSGRKDSGAISVTIAADSKCCFSYDATTGAVIQRHAIIAELTS